MVLSYYIQHQSALFSSKAISFHYCRQLFQDVTRLALSVSTFCVPAVVPFFKKQLPIPLIRWKRSSVSGVTDARALGIGDISQGTSIEVGASLDAVFEFVEEDAEEIVAGEIGRAVD